MEGFFYLARCKCMVDAIGQKAFVPGRPVNEWSSSEILAIPRGEYELAYLSLPAKVNYKNSYLILFV